MLALAPSALTGCSVSVCCAFQSLQPFDVTQLVQGELSLELARPLPVEGRFRLTSRVLEVTDKGALASCRRAGPCPGRSRDGMAHF